MSAPCTERCWTDKRCTVCGRDKKRVGRDDPGAGCTARCKGYFEAPWPPHLYSEHDSDRWYSDREGWEAHEANCARCKGDER